MDSDQGDLTKEVVALKAMIEHLKEENEALSHQLHDQSSQQLPVIRSEHDQSDLVKENIALKAMIERLKEEIQAKDQTSDIAIEDEGRKKIEQSSDDLLKENIALKELVASLTDDKRRLEAELDNRTEPTRKPTTVPVAQLIEAPVYSEQMQASIVPEQMAKNVKDGEDLKARGGSDSRDEEIVALKAMIERLKEENDVLSHQLQNQSSEVPSNVTSVVDQSGLMKENLALKAMIERLKEEIQSKDQDDSYSGEEDESGQKNDRSLNEILKENTALKAIIESLKEQLESLHDLSATQADRLQPGGHDAIETRTLPEQITETSLDEVGDINNLQKEIVALKAMIEQLKDENETLARQLEEQGSQFVSGVKEQSDLMKENSALKAMIERLKEEIDSFDQPRLPTTVADTADKKETTALKAMVENLKEDRDLLAKQLEQLKAELEDRKTDDGAGDSGHPNKIPSMETDVVRRENMALKAMLDRLKEQISILENERIMKESPELDKLTTENQILRADVCHLEEQLSKAKPERYEREIAALRETIERLKDESGEHRREEHSDLDDYSLRLKNFELRLEALQKERDDLLEQTMTFSEQIEEMQHEFSAKARKMQNDIDELIEENTNLKAALEKHPDVEQVKETFSAEVRSGQMQKEIEQLKDLLNSTAFEKIQLAGEIEQLKERIEVIQKELESKKQEAAYLQTENSDLRGLLATIQDTSKIPPDQLVARMKEENQKLQQFIQTLNDKVDRILSPEGMVVPVAQVEREKLSIENQLLTLQRQMERLELTLEEERRKTREIVNTYRSHLLAAVQGQMDPEVKQALLHIIRLRGSTAGSRTVSSTSGTSEPIPGIDATSDYKV